MSIEKPKVVEEAIRRGNVDSLRILGEKGGRHSGETRGLHKADKEALKKQILADAKAQEAAFHVMNEEGDVVPPPFAA